MEVSMPFVTTIQHPNEVFIAGKWTAPSGAAKFEVFNSGTEELFASVAVAQAADISAAVAAARDAFDHGPWPHMTHAERASYLRAIAVEMSRKAEEQARTWVIESGVTQAHAGPKSKSVAGVWEFYAGLADSFPFQEEHTPAVAKFGKLVREPVGVVAAIVPWNGPLLMIAYKCAPALLAGCTLIVKASPEAPGAAYLFAEVCEKIHLPPGVVNVVVAERESSELLVQCPSVDKVTFTGSTAAGRRIASICGGRIARCTLELGGKSAAVILDDYDVEQAAKTITGMATFLTGQVCSSLTRIIIDRKRHDAMVEALSACFSEVKVGDPFDLSTQMGPLATSRQRDRVEGYLQVGKLEGARLAIGGRRPAHMGRGYFIEPTVFGNVDNRSRLAQEEIFGPVLSVIASDGDDDAIRIANDTIYGLNNSVFTNDVERAYGIARRLSSGTVGHNSVRSDFGIAFGGFKQSGIGREGGREGLLPFLEAKTLLMDASPSAAA
jgi:acyl-CoA reductase-like NAD-dependent aldehyde dehydrogenase